MTDIQKFSQCPDCGYQIGDGEQYVAQAEREQLKRLKKENSELVMSVELSKSTLEDIKYAHVNSKAMHDAFIKRMEYEIGRLTEQLEKAQKPVIESDVKEIEGSLYAWQMVLQYVASGTPPDGLKCLAEQQIKGLNKLLESRKRA